MGLDFFLFYFRSYFRFIYVYYIFILTFFILIYVNTNIFKFFYPLTFLFIFTERFVF